MTQNLKCAAALATDCILRGSEIGPCNQKYIFYPITRRFHMSFAQQAKHHLFEIISEMASHPGDFSNHPETDFSRNRKLDFSNLLKLIVSMETGYVKDELLRL